MLPRHTLSFFSFATLAIAAMVVSPSTARADDHPVVRLGLAVAPTTVGLFDVGTDGHYGTSSTAFGGRLGVMYAPSRYFQVGVDATVLAPYGGVVVGYAAQAALRGALPLGDNFELGLTARFGPGFSRVKSGLAYDTSTTPYRPGPAVGYAGWQAGLALDATWWVSRNAAIVFAVEGILANEPTTAGNDVYLSYLSSTAGVAAVAPWVGLQLGL